MKIFGPPTHDGSTIALNFCYTKVPNRPLGDKIMKWAAIVVATAIVLAANPATARESDAQIKQKVIKESIDSYPGNCPCPYNYDRAGRRCGGRSAYNRAGGYSPKCFASDVTAAEVAARRR